MSRVERHEDYVTRLATPDNKAASGGSSGAGPRAYSNKFASAGLGADQVFLWDIDAVARPETTLRRDDSSSSGYSAGRLTPRVLQGQASSAYALAMDASGHAVATGCATGLVRVWDARENRRARALEGHAGAVDKKALERIRRKFDQMDEDGNGVLEGDEIRQLAPWVLSAFKPDGTPPQGYCHR